MRIRALTAIRYPTGERAPSGEAIEKVHKPGEVFEVSAEDADAFCRPSQGAFLHLGERQGSDAARRHTVLRAEIVRDQSPATATEGV